MPRNSLVTREEKVAKESMCTAGYTTGIAYRGLMMDESILVSILIPVYNRQDIIAATVTSAISQTHTHIEIIIVDNKSTDRTFDVCRSYQEKDSRIRVFQNKENLGPVRNWLKCLQYSSGEYVKFLWSDDWMEADYIEKTIPYLRDTSVAFAYSPADIVKSSFVTPCYRLFCSDKVYSLELFSDLAVFGGNVPVSPGCGIFRRIDVENFLLLDIPNEDNLDFTRYGAGNDLLLFLLPSINYKLVAYVASTKCYFSSHTDSLTMSNNLELYYDWAKLYFLKKISQKYGKRDLRKFKALLIIQSITHHSWEKYKNIRNAVGVKANIFYIGYYMHQFIVKMARREFLMSRKEVKE